MSMSRACSKAPPIVPASQKPNSCNRKPARGLKTDSDQPLRRSTSYLQLPASELSYAEDGVSDLADGTDCWRCPTYKAVLHFSEAPSKGLLAKKF